MKKLLERLTLVKLLLLGVLVLTQSACVNFHTSQASLSHSPKFNEPQFESLDHQGYTRPNLFKADFNKVVISGNIDAVVKTQQPKDELVFRGTQTMRRSFTAKVSDHTLYLSAGNYPANFSARTPLRVDLELATPVEQVLVKGSGTTHLSGDLTLSRIGVSGNAMLYAYWINSANLHVLTSGKAKVFLGGVASNLDIKAYQSSQIDARFLRTENAYVLTQNEATAAVKVKKSLSTLSTDYSTVYYYGDSGLNIHYLGNNGSALRMTGIDK